MAYTHKDVSLMNILFYSRGFQTVVSTVDAPPHTHKFNYRLFIRITNFRDANETLTSSGRKKQKKQNLNNKMFSLGKKL